MVRNTRRVAASAFLGATLFALAGCAVRPQVTSAPQIFPGDSASDEAVLVVGSDYAFHLPSVSLGEGVIEFLFVNGGAEPHEMAIVSTDGDRFGLPFADTHMIDMGESVVLRADLPKGSYALVCLIITPSSAKPQSHMELGMYVEFEVGS